MAAATIGGLYRHCKGGTYKVLLLATDSGTHKDVVVYQGTTSGNVWTRDREEFEGQHSSGVERFERYVPV